jgi:cytidylate kinase
MAVITISKEHGAGGKYLAEALARSLGYELVDKSLIIKVAQKAKVSAERVESFDQEQYRSVDKLLSNIFLANPAVYSLGSFDFPMVAPVGLAAEYEFFNSEKYIKLTQALLGDIYLKGNVVLVGRGGQVFLAGKPGCLHLRLCAPLEYRVQKVMEKSGLSEKEAADKIHARDKSRAAYIHDFYNRDWKDPGLYHLVVNTQLVTEDKFIALVRQLLA